MRLGNDLLGAVHDNSLRVYSAQTGRLRHQLELAHASGPPSLLSIRNGYATYASGIEVHLVRLRNGIDRVLNLPGQAGPVDALLTPRGLFVSYDRAYESQAGRISFLPWSKIH